MKFTRDTLFGGKLIVYQIKGGYRFSLDSALLAGLTYVNKGDIVVDLGCGCGVVGLILMYRYPGIKVIGVEVQDSLYRLARVNVEENGYSDNMTVYLHDFRNIEDILPSNAADLVVANPPYRRLRAGRMNPQEEKAIARHEILATIDDVFVSASYLLKNKGKIALIYPASRFDDLIVSASRHGFRPKRITIIYSDERSPAILVHVECRKGAGQELHIAPPFMVYEKDSKMYTPAMQKFYEP